MKSRSRNYVLHWNWRDDKEGSPVKMDSYKATTAPRALNKLKRELAKEYADVNDRTLIVHEIYLAD